MSRSTRSRCRQRAIDLKKGLPNTKGLEKEEPKLDPPLKSGPPNGNPGKPARWDDSAQRFTHAFLAECMPPKNVRTRCCRKTTTTASTKRPIQDVSNVRQRQDPAASGTPKVLGEFVTFVSQDTPFRDISRLLMLQRKWMRRRRKDHEKP